MSYNHEFARFSIFNNIHNRTAKSRHGRRPVSQQRPVGGFSSTPAQDTNTLQSTMPAQNVTNGSQSPQGVFSFSQQSNGLTQNFGQPSSTNPSPFSTSASFPPFGSGNSNDFKTQFPPKSSSFEFNITKNTSFNNPFASANGNVSGTSSQNIDGQSGGFQGSIFNIPPTTPFSSGNASVTKPGDQTPFNWGSTASASKPHSQPSTDIFKSSKDNSVNSSPSNPFGQMFPQQQSTSNLFGQNSAPAATPKPSPMTSDIFGKKPLSQDQNQSSQSTSNIFGQLSSQQSSNSANIFGLNATPSRQSQQSTIFSPPDEDSMSTSPDNSPQAKDPTLRPFAFLNAQNEPNTNGSNNEHVQEGGLFGRISQPPVSASTANIAEGNPPQPKPLEQPTQNPPAFSISTQNVSSGFQLTPVNAGRDAEQTSPTRSNGFKTKPIFNMPTSEDDDLATNNPFGTLKLPTTLPSSQAGAPSKSSPSFLPNNFQPSNAIENGEKGREDSLIVAAQPNSEHFTHKSIFDHPAWGTPPSAPIDFSDVQRQQLVIGYQLKCLDAGFKHYVSNNQSFHADSETIGRFYSRLKDAILNGEGITQELLNGGKRKSVFDEYEDEVFVKKARFDNADTNNGGLVATSSTAQPLLTEPASLPQALNTKRKADDDISGKRFENSNDRFKRIRGDSLSNVSLSSPSSSQTSNIFKNILDSKDPDSSQDTLEPAAIDIQKGNPSPQFPSTGWSSSKPLSTPKGDYLSKSPPSNTTSDSLQRNAPISSNTYSSKLSTPTSKPIFAPSLAQPTVSATRQNPFSSDNQVGNNLSSNPPVTSSFAPPKFDVAPVNFLSQFGKVAEDNAKKEKEIRKAKDFDSDEDDEAEWERKDAEEQLAKKQKLDDISKGKTTQFIPGKGFALSNVDTEKEESGSTGVFGSLPGNSVRSVPQESSTSVLSRPSQGLANGHNIFSHLSDAESGPEGSKTGDADDEDTGSEKSNEHVVEDDRTDESKFGITKEKSKSLADSNPFGSSSLFSSNSEAAASTEAADQIQSTGRSLFDRISKVTDGNLTQIVPPPTEKKNESLFKPTSSQPSTNIFGQTTQGFGSNMFGNSSLATPKVNLFGQPSSASSSSINSPVPPSTPKPNASGQSPNDSPTPIIGSSNSPGGDNTWKVDSPIKFGTSSSNPSGILVSSPTPSKAPLGGLFGSIPANSVSDNTSKPPSNSVFISTPAKAPTDVGFGFNFGGPPKVTLGTLAPPSNMASATTSRATSPGVTTGGESANESIVDEGGEKHEQLNLSARGPGEEDEDVLFTAKAKAISYDASSKSWPSQGVGMLRVLKHRESAKTRILMRQDPSGKIVLNAALLSTLNYEYSKPKAVKMAVATDAGKLSTWMIRVGKDEDAVELARVLEANKSN